MSSHYLIISIAEIARASQTPVNLWGCDPDAELMLKIDGSLSTIQGQPLPKEIARGNNPMVQAKLRKWFPYRLDAELAKQRQAKDQAEFDAYKYKGLAAAAAGRAQEATAEVSRLLQLKADLSDRSVITALPRS